MKDFAKEYHAKHLGNCAMSVAAAWLNAHGGDPAEVEKFKACGAGHAPGGLCGARRRKVALPKNSAGKSHKFSAAAEYKIEFLHRSEIRLALDKASSECAAENRELRLRYFARLFQVECENGQFFYTNFLCPHRALPKFRRVFPLKFSALFAHFRGPKELRL